MSTFIDLFAGIGGFRQGFENAGFSCVFSSEIDPHAQMMYEENFGERPFGDISKIHAKEIPPFDVLLAGFPCQPFSIAGSKKGFNDTRGHAFFEIVRIIKHHRPKAVVLENVKHFKSHDKGRTLKTIISTLTELGYKTSWKVLNAKDFGVAQNRERTIIVASTVSLFNFDVLEYQNPKVIADILEETPSSEYLNESEYTLIKKTKTQTSGLIFCGYLNKKTRTKGVRVNTEHLSRAHKQPNRIYSSEGTHPTLSSQEVSGRYFILHQGKVRKLSIEECYLLMGFPTDFKRVGTKSKLYRRIGNSIVVPMVYEIAKNLKTQVLK